MLYIVNIYKHIFKIIFSTILHNNPPPIFGSTMSPSEPESFNPTTLTQFVSSRLAELADPEDAAAMARYMKTEMPFYGVKTKPRRAIFKEAVKRFPVASREEYEAAVLALWALPHREERYGAIEYAWGFKSFITPASLPLYQRLIVEGAWWDLVDGVAPWLVGPMLADTPEEVRPTLDRWAAHDDVWLRRSAIIAQLRIKQRTDTGLLLCYCEMRLADEEFWVRKAIGWALRTHARIEPEAVRDFVVAHRDEMSKLSWQEAARGLVRAGYEV